MRTTKLFGIPIAVGKREELLTALRSLLEEGGTVATVNATMLEHARKSKTFAKTLCSMSLCIPDGEGVRLALKKRGVETDTLPGVELALLLPERKENLRLALYGGRVGVGERAWESIRRHAQSTQLVYIKDGYSHSPFEVGRELSALSVDLLYVCLGSPRQEEVACMLSRILPCTLIIGLGGTLDVLSGDIPRAPKKIRELGCEWLWRMAYEPRRFVKFPSLLSFGIHSFLERLHTKSTKSEAKR